MCATLKVTLLSHWCSPLVYVQFDTLSTSYTLGTSNTLYIPCLGFFGAQVLLVSSHHDSCTGHYVEELDRRYNKSVSCVWFHECLPAERMQFTVTALANYAYACIALSNAILCQYCTMINYGRGGLRQWCSYMTNSHACNLIGSPGSWTVEWRFDCTHRISQQLTFDGKSLGVVLVYAMDADMPCLL